MGGKKKINGKDVVRKDLNKKQRKKKRKDLKKNKRGRGWGGIKGGKKKMTLGSGGTRGLGQEKKAIREN